MQPPPPLLVTVTVKLQLSVLTGVVAVQLTVVVLNGKFDPDGGTQDTLTQLPVVVGAG